jgi:two-component system OmpR family response regulator
MRILVVEDEAALSRAIRTALEEESYAVDTASDGESGLFSAEGGSYDAIVLDLMLPRLGGLEVLRKLRKKSAAPVLILTARDTIDDKLSGLNAGADDYLTKPFELRELIARVRALVRRSAGKPAPVLRLGDIEVDTTSRIVKRGGKRVELTAKEYSLVELLALHRGELVTRTLIYERLYDENDDTLSNVVDVYISNLRRKLGRKFIETRRNQGYIAGV